jgi:hypothetical protein
MKPLERENRGWRYFWKENRSQVPIQHRQRVSAQLAARKEEAVRGR